MFTLEERNYGVKSFFGTCDPASQEIAEVFWFKGEFSWQKLS